MSLAALSYSCHASSRLFSNCRFSFSNFNFPADWEQAALASLFPLFRRQVPSKSVVKSCAYLHPIYRACPIQFKVVGIFRADLSRISFLFPAKESLMAFLFLLNRHVCGRRVCRYRNSRRQLSSSRVAPLSQIPLRIK